jgi:hypothetical protein
MSLKQNQPLVLAFDPGAVTGVAVVSAKKVIRTEALNAELVLQFARRMRRKYRGALVVIEEGPKWRSDSPLTRNVEGELKKLFPDAALVPPNRWKGHPAAQCHEQLATTHQRDAVRLARWFLAKRSNTNGESQNARADAA